MKKILSIMICALLCLNIQIVRAQDRVTSLLNAMTLKQKIEQMMMVDFRNWDVNNKTEEFTIMNDEVKNVIESHNFGAIILFKNNIQETKQAFLLTKAMQEASLKNNGIPLFISSDQEGGIVYRLSTGTALPGNMALGAARNPKYALEAGEIIGSELSALGINTDLAPVVDVNNNANNPVIGLRSFSDDPNLVGTLASKVIEGLKKYNVIAAAKHFPGHGDVATDSHYGLPIVNKSKNEIMNNELLPYKLAIQNDIEMIMSAHILYPSLEKDKIYSEKTGKEESVPATMSDDILTKLLKNEMNFKGVIVTDAMNMKAISDIWSQSQAVIESIKAGADLICMPTRLQNLDDVTHLDTIIQDVEEKINEGYIPLSRINDAVTRILILKNKRGILDYDETHYSLSKALNIVGGNENRTLEREIAANSVTVIKNENNTLPLKLKENQKVLMLAPYENEKAQLLMGINRAKELNIVPQNVEVKILSFNKNTTIENLKSDLDWSDVTFINSEISNPSKMGYKSWLSKIPNDVVNYLHEVHKKSIIMSVDKPYDVQLYPNADAILAVYGAIGSTVDVTEALINHTTTSKEAYGPNIIAGVEVALGTFGARGKLPVNILKYNSQTSSYDNSIVYKRGYGLTYESVLDKSKLLKLFKDIENLNTKSYTKDSYQKLYNGYLEALKIKNKLVSQDTIDKTYKQLLSLYQNLEKVKETKPIKQEETQIKQKQENNVNTNTKAKKQSQNVKTNDPQHFLIYSTFILISGLIIFYLKRKYN